MSISVMHANVTIDGWKPIGCLVEVTRSRIGISTALDETTWDPRWIYVDRNGHFHGYMKDGSTPTLRVNEHEALECVICAIEVRPGRKVSQRGGETQYVPGPKEADIFLPTVPDDHPLTRFIYVRGRLPIGSKADALSLFVDVSPRAYFGIGWYTDVVFSSVHHVLDSVKIKCSFLEEVSYV